MRNLIGATEAARALGISARALRLLRKKGRLASYRHSAKCFTYDMQDIEKYLQRIRVEAFK